MVCYQYPEDDRSNWALCMIARSMGAPYSQMDRLVNGPHIDDAYFTLAERLNRPRPALSPEAAPGRVFSTLEDRDERK